MGRVQLPTRIKVKKVEDWYEAYLTYQKGIQYSYVMGKLDPDITLVITDAWIDPKIRSKGWGSRMVSALKRYTHALRVTAYAVLPEAKGFWDRVGVPEVQHLGKKRRLRKERLRYLAEEGSEDLTPQELIRT